MDCYFLGLRLIVLGRDLFSDDYELHYLPSNDMSQRLAGSGRGLLQNSDAEWATVSSFNADTQSTVGSSQICTDVLVCVNETGDHLCRCVTPWNT